ncbi:lysophospholipid acyltransferase family protein, partial [candidate division WOR-3 bacterium]|nr:lysophospholipid acyltransferase family protein [candidate division WOR-3 bacterium]
MDEFKLRLVSWVGRLLVTVIGRSLRIRDEGEIPEGTVIYAFWHSDSFSLIYAHRFQNVVVLVSTHRDGEFLTRIVKPLGYKVIRGSSSGEGARGFLKLLKLNNSSFAITPDGPVGPPHQVKDGVLKLAELTGLPIIPVGVGISRLVRFGSWDRYKLPLLFSRCVIYWGTPIWVKKS